MRVLLIEDDRMIGTAMQQALMGVDEHTHLHLSFDVDFLDPDIAPGVGTAVRGGAANSANTSSHTCCSSRQ